MKDKIQEFRLGNFGHTLIDVVSAVSDFFSFGTIGPVVDILHGFLYLHERENETDPIKRSALLMQSAVTFASVLLPAATQTASIAVKKAIPKMVKGEKVDQGVVAGFKEIWSKVSPILKSLKKMIRHKDLDKIVEKVKTSKPKASKEALMGYAYISVLCAMMNIDAKKALLMPDELAKKSYVILSDIDNLTI